MTYDAMGRITNRTDVAGNATWTYGDPAYLHAVTQAGSSAYTYAYDANGNATSRNGQSIVWNKYNYPTIINNSGTENVTLSYSADDQRWKQVYVNGSTSETTYYLGGLMEKVTTGSTIDYRHYIYGVSRAAVAVVSRKSTGTNAVSYVLSDHQDSPSSIRDSSGNLIVNESFSAYGNRRDPGTWIGAASGTDLTASANVTRQGYTWQTALGNMGLNHMNGRVQDAVTGVFISADPYVTEPMNTQNYNRYSYVYNNPLTYTDPSGFDVPVTTSGGLDQVTILGYRTWWQDDFEWFVLWYNQAIRNSTPPSDAGGGGGTQDPGGTEASPTPSTPPTPVVTVKTEQTQNRKFGICKSVVAVGSATLGGAAGGFFSGGGAGAFVGAVGGAGGAIFEGTLNTALGSDESRYAGTVGGAVEGALSSGGHGIAGSAAAGAAGGAFGDAAGWWGAIGATIASGTNKSGGFYSLTTTARRMNNLFARGVLTGVGGAVGWGVENGLRQLGNAACEEMFQ